MSEIKRGQVYWVDFDPPVGKHPALIVQNDAGNKYAPTVIVTTITSVPSKKQYPTDVLIPDGALPKNNSRVLTATIITIPKDALGECITKLSDSVMEAVDRALMVSLDLEKYL